MATTLALVRNNAKGPVCWNNFPTSDLELLWGGRDAPDGTDIQPVPEAIFDSPHFQRAVREGVFTIEQAAPEVQAALDERLAFYERNEENRLARAEAQRGNHRLPRNAPRCAGPDEVGNEGECGRKVAMSPQAVREQAPLCEHHEHLRNLFALTFSEHEIDRDTLNFAPLWVRMA
jgi:hypothetical protein